MGDLTIHRPAQHLAIVELPEQILGRLEALNPAAGATASQRADGLQSIAGPLDRDTQAVDRLTLVAQLSHQPAGMQKQLSQGRQLEFPHPAIPGRFAPGAELGLLEPALQLGHHGQVGTALQRGHHGPMGQLTLPAQLLQHGLEVLGLSLG